MSPFPDSRTLVIFDVDGTLVDAHPMDNDAFDLAFREETGVPLTAEIWETFTEVTAKAIIKQALPSHHETEVATLSSRVHDSFVANLHSGHGRDASSIRAYPGAVQLLSDLQKSPNFSVAIATGCWRESALFKLGMAGFDLTGIPFACASDCYSRADIIRMAAERAGIPVERAIYVGDGPWDLRATQQLGIPFIGVGRKIEALRAAGAEYTLERLDFSEIDNVIARIHGKTIPSSLRLSKAQFLG
jgi:phosphoglycolate phosphatase-like HAD superfamily hydrolase